MAKFLYSTKLPQPFCVTIRTKDNSFFRSFSREGIKFS